MRRLAGTLGAAFLLFSLGGCALTDDYYLESQHASGGEATGGTVGGSGVIPRGGGAGNSSAQGGGVAVGSSSGGAESMLLDAGGANDAGAATGGAPAEPCQPSTERCNGHDDNCNGLIDELVCNSNQYGTTGCTGFVIDGSSRHGYMLCTGNPKPWAQAQRTCEGQEMRLAWLETPAENAAVSATISKLTNAPDVLIGATDQVKEGAWVWDGNGGFQFWHGAANGMPVSGTFNAWGMGSPNNANNAEDCGVLNPQTAQWDDRSCFADYAFLCEDLN
jgi:hypothetical protein